MSSDINPNILVEAKAEYTKQLCNFLINPIYQGIESIYKDVSSVCKKEKNTKGILIAFQMALKSIPKWNQEVIDNEFKRISSIAEDEFLDNLIRAVFISYVKVLASVRLGNKFKKIQLSIPSGKIFLHKCYIEVARETYSNPFLFSHEVKETDMLINSRKSKKMISNCIIETIRKLIPLEQIMKQYLGEDYDEGDEGVDEDISKNITDREMSNLKKLVQAEIQSELLHKKEAEGDKKESEDPVKNEVEGDKKEPEGPIKKETEGDKKESENVKEVDETVKNERSNSKERSKSRERSRSRERSKSRERSRSRGRSRERKSIETEGDVKSRSESLDSIKSVDPSQQTVEITPNTDPLPEEKDKKVLKNIKLTSTSKNQLDLLKTNNKPLFFEDVDDYFSD